MATNESSIHELAEQLRHVQAKLAELDGPGASPAIFDDLNHGCSGGPPRTTTIKPGEVDDAIWDLIRYC